MNKSTKMVKEFHELFNHPVNEIPQALSINRGELRVELLREEIVDELHPAIAQSDLLETLDAYCDIQYVLNGAILESGMAELFEEAFAEVHRSNMSKACVTLTEANDTMIKYKKEGVNCYSKGKTLTEGTTVYLIYRDIDNKILKSINYSPANLQPIINKHLKQ